MKLYLSLLLFMCCNYLTAQNNDTNSVNAIKANLVKTYDSVDDLKGGYYKCKKDGLYGVVDSKSNIIVPIKYDNVTRLSIEEPGAWVKSGSYWGYYAYGMVTIPIHNTNATYYTNAKCFAAENKDGFLYVYDSSLTLVSKVQAILDDMTVTRVPGYGLCYFLGDVKNPKKNGYYNFNNELLVSWSDYKESIKLKETADNYYDRDKYKDAIKYYKKSIALYPDPKTFSDLGFCCYMADKEKKPSSISKWQFY